MASPCSRSIQRYTLLQLLACCGNEMATNHICANGHRQDGFLGSIEYVFSHSVYSLLTMISGKIASAPSANIFTNREYEMLVRSLNLRRLSLVVLAGSPNKFLTQLPSIQEKLVDVLKSSAAPVVQSEVRRPLPWRELYSSIIIRCTFACASYSVAYLRTTWRAFGPLYSLSW
jgi:hypothetical protein